MLIGQYCSTLVLGPAILKVLITTLLPQKKDSTTVHTEKVYTTLDIFRYRETRLVSLNLMFNW